MADPFARLGFSEEEAAALVVAALAAYERAQDTVIPTKERLKPKLRRAQRAAMRFLEALDDWPDELIRAFNAARAQIGDLTPRLSDALGDRPPYQTLHWLTEAIAGFDPEINAASSRDKRARARDFAANMFIGQVKRIYEAKTKKDAGVTVDAYGEGSPRVGDFADLLKAVAERAGVPIVGLVRRASSLLQKSASESESSEDEPRI